MKTDMIVCNSKNSLRVFVAEAKKKGRTVGFVPTMGYLHEGHLSLVRLVLNHCDLAVVSIFINPTQFNNQEDLKKYPIDIPRDLKLLESVGADCVFVPEVVEMYAPNHQSWLLVEGLSAKHEGEFRPGHFRGVATVVAILFNTVLPDIAVFGEKDFQQLRIIEKLVEDLSFSVKILRGPIVREPDGLAMSSRNARLSPSGREKAPVLNAALQRAAAAYKNGDKYARAIEQAALAELIRESSIQVEYLRVVRESDLAEVEVAEEGTRVILAAWVDGIRLIDNVKL